MYYKCNHCGSNSVVQSHGTWSCKECGYVPPHGSD
ncbi:hypothetical protein [Haladaptatus sp. SPP-AMP-3]